MMDSNQRYGIPYCLARSQRLPYHRKGRIDPDRLGDILEVPRAEIADQKIEPRFHLAIGVLGQADGAAGVRSSVLKWRS